MKYFVAINVKSTLHYYFLMVQVKIYNGKIKKIIKKYEGEKRNKFDI